jgi:hypothetical protein
MKINSIVSKEHFAADHDFYKDKKGYYTNTKIGVFKNMIAWILEKMIVRMMGSNA